MTREGQPLAPGCVHELFADQARATPAAVAVASGEQLMTYAELELRANRMAHHLSALGVGPESLVGISLPRGHEAVVALLGILKAGGAYVPLDPEYPRERLAFMLADTGVRVVVTEEELAGRFEGAPVSLVLVDRDREEIAARPGEALASGACPAHLAYVLYTSGSTGRPKGVMTEHRNVVGFVRAMADIRCSDVVLQLAPLSFDASTFELWVPLLNGATVAVHPPGRPDSRSLRALIARHRVSMLFLTAALHEAVVREDVGALRPLRRLLAGGDALDVDSVNRSRRELPATELVNCYGPTETTTFTCLFPVTGDVTRSVPIGRPLSGYRVHVLAPDLAPVPAGGVGELYIGGAGVARGYLDRPELTAERFVADPFVPGERLYRTGDMARFLPDGNVEFLGRTDHQVKIRGFRIELGEVEAALKGQPGVRDAVVLAREFQPQDKRLVAYLVPDPEATPLEADDQHEQVTLWRNLFEDVYRTPGAAQDPTFNVTGWRDSRTGRPIPEEEMREWVERAVERIASLTPRRILEIGCGTGLLLARVAPLAERYLATDLSPGVVEQLRRLVAARPELAHVRVEQRAADTHGELEPGSFDTVLLNSVIQYFPDAGYLERVLAAAARLVRPGGRIFVGDVRSLSLLDAYALFAQLPQAAAGTTAAQLGRVVRERVTQEEELVVAPAFFDSLVGRVPGIGAARIELKRGRFLNEMTRFRYDVTLFIGEPAAPSVDWEDWSRHDPDLAAVRRRLARERPEVFGLKGVPNTRLTEENIARRWLAEEAGTVGELRERLAVAEGEGLDPEALWTLAAEEGYTVGVTWSGTPDGAFDVLFSRAPLPAGTPWAPREIPTGQLTNDPLWHRRARRLTGQVRRRLQEQLPGHMVPAAFVVLHVLPLSPSGKVDRKALPAPEGTRPRLDEEYVAPRTPLEEQIAAIWAEVLGLDRVGVRDGFLELGGHSLLATRIVSRLRETFQVELSLAQMLAAPTVARLAEVLATLQSAGSAPPLTPRRRGGPLPLSFAQQRLWFIDRLEPGGTEYRVPLALRMRGALDTAALRRALDEVVARHEVLRTRYLEGDGGAVQVIDLPASLELSHEDMRALPPEEREPRLSERLAAEERRLFNLATGPVIRALLVRTAEDEHLLLVTTHHIASDGWSLEVLARELGELYSAFASGRPSPLAPPPIQYADFAIWQREWMAGEILERQLGYWREKLAGLEPLDLMADRPRPPVRDPAGASVDFVVEAEVARALHALGQERGATLFMVLLAGFQALLARYAGKTDVTVGTPIAGRTRVELESLIGFFINSLVLRTDLSGDPPFTELLARVKETTLEAYAHQDLPFERLVDALHPQRDLSRHPLFQVMFALQNYGAARAEMAGLAVEDLGLVWTAARFDLTLQLRLRGDGTLAGELEYATALFDRGTAARMIGHYARLLEHVATAPSTRLSRLDILSDAERRRLLVEWNDTGEDHPGEACIHELFEAQAARTPEAPAVELEGACLTYRQLDTRANQLAHRLRRLGVGPETLVALCVERSSDMLVGWLGVLKAGGAYVPLDSSYPRERLAFALEDTRAPVLLTQRRLLPALPACSARVLCLDSDWEEVAREPPERPRAGAHPDNLAYAIYTSGSTGQPKAVGVSHRALLNLVSWHLRQYRLSPSDRTTQLAGLAFDASAWEVWPTLASGACLCLPTEEARSRPELLLRWLAETRITVSFLPTPLAEAVLEQPWPEDMTLRALLTGGDQLRLRAGRVPPTALVNHYGPTENAVVTTRAPVEARAGLPPIGRPITNVRAYVLDGNLQPVPVGVPGELYIGGAGLARGYLGRPALTAERFVPDSFSTEPGARLYRTGDLVRYLPDGDLEFLGRCDSQVKVRGFRIELGEVEAVLAQHPAVRQAVVLAGEGRPGDKRLVAYVVGHEGAPDSKALCDFVKQRLPEYMVPSAFMVMDALPLTPNGKVDRKALPVPEVGGPGAGHVAPRTPTEEVLAGIWAEVLGYPRAGLEDNFFELGGHSLLATRVVSRIRTSLGVELPLRALFEAPTVAALAQRVEASRQAGSAIPAPPLLPVQRAGELPLSFAQQRLWFLDQLQPGSAFYNIPVAFLGDGPLDVAALEASFDELVRRHEVLRTTFVEREGRPVQTIAPAVSFSLVPLDLRGLPVEAREARARELAREEALRPFELARGPLFRVTLLRLAAERHLLLITLHHIVSDGWSMGVLARELVALYAAHAAGKRLSLPPLPIQYADYAVWQRGWLRGEVLARQLDYWRERIAGVPVLELPTDRPRPPMQTFRGAWHFFLLPRALSDALETSSRKEGVTLFMTLLAAFEVLLHRHSGQDDFAIGSPIAGRRFAELEGLIGFFANTLVLRARLEGNPSFRDILARARETTLGAYAQQDVPFEKLVEELQPERSLSHSPIFQVMFVLQNAPVGELALPGLTLRPLEVEGDTAKFDLTLSVEDTPEGLRGALEYNTDLFDAGTVVRMASHLRVLLEAVVADPEMKRGELPLLTAAERHQLLVEWNDTHADYPRDACVHELFERQAARAPDAVAVEFEGTRLTYGQLEARANQLAHHLRRLGVVHGTPVALCVERSLDMVVATLAILKAGGAYVPLDSSSPRERLALTLEDTRAKVLLTERRLVERLPGGSAKVVLLDAERSIFERESEAPPCGGATADSLAYVMYTSGSTGRPKGVCIPHRAVVRLVVGSRFAELSEREVFLQLAPISFDAATFELWGSLLHGARLVVSSPHTPTFEELGRALERHRVTTLWLTAALFEQMVASQLDALGGVRQLLAGGDVLSVGPVKARLARGGVLVNGYGPTESTTFACCHVMTRAEQVGHSVSIGRPIANTQVYVLDEHLHPVPVGVRGELYIGGDGLAWGYLHQPELTAEKFIPNPFPDSPGARLYRTGDLVRHLPGGDLEFLGRRDLQVKVRGFRIELEEVEAALAQHPAVRQVIVLAREDRPGDRRLVAYVAGHEGPPDSKTLRDFVKQRLPEYMVPSVFVSLETLPLTANGKVDRKALPAPEARSDGAGYVAPRTPAEELLAGIWSEVLGHPRVGVEDNFFDLGGHSLLGTQVMSRVREAFAVELPLRCLFEAPTLSGLAERLERARPLVSLPLAHAPRGGPLPLSFAQKGLWFLEQLQPGNAAYHIADAQRLRGVLDVAALERSFNEIVRRHEVLRTTFVSVDGEPVQVIAPALELTLPVVDLRELHGDEQEAQARRLMSAEAQRAFDLARGPLLRGLLLRLGAEEHLLQVTMHHLVSDGWSLVCLGRELATLYAALSSGNPSPLPELPVQYADFTLWQREWLRGEALERLLAYWKRQLDGAPPCLTIPPDRPRPPVQTFRGASQAIRLAPALTRTLELLGRQERASLFMVLLAVFKVLLSRYTGQQDIVVGTSVANRSRTEVEGLVGFFISTVVLRARLAGGSSFRELLRQARGVTLEAHAHQELPFEKLVEELNPGRDPSYNPLFQVLFNLNHAADVRPGMPGLSVEPVRLEAGVAQFDLSIELERDAAQGMIGLAIYNTDLYNDDTISQLLRHYEVLLEQVAATPDEALDVLLATIPARSRPATPVGPAPEARRVGPVDDITQRRARLAARRAALTAPKQELLERRLAGAPADAPSLERVPPHSGSGSAPDTILVCLQDGGVHRRPLFFVHGGSGGVLGYAALARHLPPDRPLYGLRAPGLDGGEALPACLEDIARHYVSQVRAAQPHGPYLLGGWSFGGLVAFEMAQRLQAAGERVALLALVDVQAPDARPAPPLDEMLLLASFGLNLGIFGRHLAPDMAHLERLAGRDRLAYVLELARQAPAGAPELELDQVERCFTVFKRHVEAQRRYVPRPYAGPAVLFRASTQMGDGAQDLSLGWDAWITGTRTAHEVPGDHFSMLREPHVGVLAERLVHHLNAVDQVATT